LSSVDASGEEVQQTITQATEEKITVGLAYFRSLQADAKKGKLLPAAARDNIELKNKVKSQHEEINKLSQSLVTTSKLIEKEMPGEIKIKLSLSELSQWTIKQRISREGNDRFKIKGDIELTYDTEQAKIVRYSYV